jgi:hypothetical protein
MQTIHKIENINFEGSMMMLVVDGKKYSIDLESQSKILSKSSKEIKNNYQISPSGYGIHWPDIDEDLSIDGLIGIKHTKPKISHLKKVS